MSEDKKTEFGTKWIGETPIERHMREEAAKIPPEGIEILPPTLPPVKDGEPAPKGELVYLQGPKYVYGRPREIPPWEDLPKGEPEYDNNWVGESAGVTDTGEKNGVEPQVEVTGVEITPEEQRQGYSWTATMEVKNGEVKVTANSPVVQAENVGDGWGSEQQSPEETVQSETNLESRAHKLKQFKQEQQIYDQAPGIPEDRMREVTVPFAASTIREYFADKSLFFIANYSESKLKGTAFLTYLSNINIPSDVKFNMPIGYDEYAEIMKAYMEQPGIINAAGLHVMAAEMLLVAKGLPYDRSPYALPIDEKTILMFIEEHYEMVQKWLHFVDSTQVYALRSIKTLNEHYKPEERFPVVEDASYVGWNIAQLYRIPEFIAMYFSIENAEYKQSYFRHQYEEYMFKNETLAKYFRSQNNFAALYFSHFAAGSFEVKHIEHGLFRTGVFDPNSEYYEATPYVASLQV